MKCAEILERENLPVQTENIIQMPLGLFGFEEVKRYVLLGKPGEEPFLWLQMLEKPNLAFLVIPATEIAREYQPDISRDDVEFLGLSEPVDALVYNIVTLRGNGRATVNLKGPVVLNRYTLTAKQVVPANASEYPLQHPLNFGE